MNLITNINGVNRNMTEQEQADYLAWQKEKHAHAKSQEKALTDKAAAKQAVLDRLGITADEAALLLG
jgi:hypothetical protein